MKKGSMVEQAKEERLKSGIVRHYPTTAGKVIAPERPRSPRAYLGSLRPLLLSTVSLYVLYLFFAETGYSAERTSFADSEAFCVSSDGKSRARTFFAPRSL